MRCAAHAGNSAESQSVVASRATFHRQKGEIGNDISECARARRQPSSRRAWNRTSMDSGSPLCHMAIFSEFSEISANVAPSGMVKETEPSSNLSSTFVAMSLFFEVLRTQTSHHELEYLRCSFGKTTDSEITHGGLRRYNGQRAAARKIIYCTGSSLMVVNKRAVKVFASRIKSPQALRE